MTKHKKIIDYITTLKIGSKISVRLIAQEMKVSEGTAYRAIKEAESNGIVKTIPRIGTVRVEKIEKKEIEKITFAEVVNIVDGTILGGREGLHKTLSRFLIGAMEIDNMKKYIEPESLLIVGNRDKAQKVALDYGAAVLISGGFGTSEKIIEYANKLKLPIISSSYDTFTIATLINKAIFQQLIKKEIVLVEDVMATNPYYLLEEQTIEDWRNLVKESKHGRFPVLNKENNVVGIVTVKDTAGVDGKILINKAMTKEPITLPEKASVAYAAHIMVWEGIELIPVVRNKQLVGVVSREDVIKALQHMQNQPHIGETLDDLILSTFKEKYLSRHTIQLLGKAVSAMLNPLGTVSCGSMITIMSTAGFRIIRKLKKTDTVSENIVVYFLRPLQLDDDIEVIAQIIEEARTTMKVDIQVFSKGNMAAKGLMSAKTIEK